MLIQETKTNLLLLLKAGLPFTLLGIAAVFLGIHGIRYFFSESRYFTVILFLWLALFWFIYQPMFRKRIIGLKRQLNDQ